MHICFWICVSVPVSIPLSVITRWTMCLYARHLTSVLPVADGHTARQMTASVCVSVGEWVSVSMYVLYWRDFLT